MKVTLPEDIKDITLNQFQRFTILNKQLEDEELTANEYNKKKISLFSGIPYHQIKNVQQKQLEEVLEQIDKALNEDAEFIDVFKIGSEQFGFIPNLNEITSAEYFDLNTYGVEVETLHNLMAILFRPIKRIDSFGNYDIKSYNGTDDYADLMKQTPMNIVNGALVFFCNLSSELQSYILRYTEAELLKEQQQVT